MFLSQNIFNYLILSCVILFKVTPYSLLNRTVNVEIATMLIELNGIKMAAINGVRFPVTAKAKPDYIVQDREDIADDQDFSWRKRRSLRKRSISWILSAFKMASELGVKRNTSSDTAIPTSAISSAPASLSPSPTISTVLFIRSVRCRDVLFFVLRTLLELNIFGCTNHVGNECSVFISVS
jgi:hypothetical protein